MREFRELILTEWVAGRASCRRWVASTIRGGSAMKINTQLLLALLLITLIPLFTIGLLSYVNAKDAPNLRNPKLVSKGVR